MKRQGTGNREEGTRRIAELLRLAVPRTDEGAPPDLWPAMQRRLRLEEAPIPERARVPWFDWALAGGLVALLAVFPTWIPVLLYYL